MVIFIVGEIEPSNDYQKTNLLSSCAPVFQELRKSGKFCDIEIKVGNRTISAHRVILAGVVPYFYKVLCSANPDNGRKMEIVMRDMDPDVIESLIDFCYTGKIQNLGENIEKLLICADLFELADIRDICIKFMAKNLNLDNVIKFKRAADSTKSQELISASNNLICNNFVDVASSQDFLLLKSNEIVEILGKDELKVVTEQQVYEAAMKWVKYNGNERASTLPEILKRIRLTHLSSYYLVNEVSEEKLIRQSLECRDVLDEAKNYQIASVRRHWTPKLLNVQPRQYRKQVIYMVCGSNLDSDNQFRNSVLKFEDNQWTIVTKLLNGRRRLGVTLMNQKIYVIGGTVGEEEYSSSVQAFDLETSEWLKAERLIEKRRMFGLATLNDCIYVCGGERREGVISSVECFSESQNEWKEIASLNQHRKDLQSVELNGFIYAVGGCSGGDRLLHSCEKYCPKSNVWSFVKPMKTAKCWFGIATLNGKIYACGGKITKNTYSNLCEVYDPKSDCWSSIAPMQEKKSNFAFASCNGKLYAIGGFDGTNFMRSVEEYCPEKDEWKFLTPLPKPGGSGMMAVILTR